MLLTLSIFLPMAGAVAVPVNAFSPQAMCVFDDGGGSKIYVGGYFLNGSPQPWRMLQFDGTNWTDVSAGLPTATPATLEPA